VRETVAPKSLAIAIGPPATADDLIALWETAARERGRLPLVISIDNSGPGRSKKVRAWLRRNEVVALFNVPHVPQHNAFVERTIGELKCAVDGEREREEARADSPACTCEPSLALCRSQSGSIAAPRCASCSHSREGLLRRLLAEWAAAAWDLNANTPRPKLDGLTADELDRIAPDAEDRVHRARFYRDACAALARAAAEHPQGRARRRAEREAIYSTLEQHGLLTRTRGGQPLSRPSKRKGIS
jgi:transposase InsO family protein